MDRAKTVKFANIRTFKNLLPHSGEVSGEWRVQNVAWNVWSAEERSGIFVRS